MTRYRGRHTGTWQKLVLLIFKMAVLTFSLIRPFSLPNPAKNRFCSFSKRPPFSLVRLVSIPNPAKNRFCSFSKWPPFSLIRPVSIQTLTKTGFVPFQNGRHFTGQTGQYTKPWQESFCSFSKWPPFSMVRPVSIPNPGKNRFLFLFKMSSIFPGQNRSTYETLARTGFVHFLKWPPVSLVRTGQHTKPWKEPVFVPFQNGVFFVEADAVSVHSAAGLERICMTMVSYGYFGDLLRLSERRVLKNIFLNMIVQICRRANIICSIDVYILYGYH